MNEVEIKKILEEHKLFLNDNGGKRADLRRVDLRGADLSGADLRGADLRGADLSEADLREADLSEADLREADLSGADLSGADLRGADLLGADLREADLRRANIDFSCLPLRCGSFNMIVDDNILEQLLTHIRRLNIKNCSDKNKALVKKIPKSVERGLEQRQGI
jgi:uncharacterized protein YjbI with pentapeptide repeats